MRHAACMSVLVTAGALASAAAQGASGMVRVNLRQVRNAARAGELESRLEAALRQIEEGGRQVADIVGRRA